VEQVDYHFGIKKAAARRLNDEVCQIGLMVLVDFSGERSDVLLDRLAFADSLENEILHILV
jgi:hypothetical protein